MDIPYKILEDGKLVLNIGLVPAKIHAQTEKVVKELNDLLGGAQKRERQKGAHEHHVHTTEQHHTH